MKAHASRNKSSVKTKSKFEMSHFCDGSLSASVNDLSSLLLTRGQKDMHPLLLRIELIISLF